MEKSEPTKINVLMNIESYYGEHTGRVGPIIKFLLVAGIPLLLYIFFLISIVPIKWVLVFEVPFALRMALRILGQENEKFRVYMAAREDEYANANDIIQITRIQDDGLVEYENGTVAYIISAFTTTYFDEDELNADLEKFVAMLGKYSYDIHMHMVHHEFLLQDNLDRMRVYTDNKELLKERIDMCVYQDEVMSQNTALYRINFVVKGARYEWKILRNDVQAAVRSSYAKVFKQCRVCDKRQANDVMSRDLYLYVELEEMIKKKYTSEEYYGSKVYYYGDEMPVEYQEEKEDVGFGKRRVMEEVE